MTMSELEKPSKQSSSLSLQAAAGSQVNPLKEGTQDVAMAVNQPWFARWGHDTGHAWCHCKYNHWKGEAKYISAKFRRLVRGLF